MLYIISSLFGVGDLTELKALGFTVQEIVVKLKEAEQEKTLVSCCLASDAPLLDEFKRRYGIAVPTPGDMTAPELRSPEDAIVVIRCDPRYPTGKYGLTTTPLDIKLFALPTENGVVPSATTRMC